MTPDIYKARRV